MAKNRVPLKVQLLIFGWVLATLLAFFTLPSLWEYVDLSQADNAWMKKIGIAASEAMIFGWVWWHVYRRYWATRVWCLIAVTIMGIVCIVHASAVGKYNSAKKEANTSLSALASGLAGITSAGSQGAVEGAGKVAANLQQNGAPNAARAAVREGAGAAVKVGEANGKTLAETALKMEDQARSSTFLSPDYLNGKMFVVIFVALLVLSGITFGVFEFFKAEEDDDEDGVPNFADIDSSYYDAKRAEKWWKERGQLAPHQVRAPEQPSAPATIPSPSYAKSPDFGFAQGVPKPVTAPDKKSLFRKLWGQAPLKRDF